MTLNRGKENKDVITANFSRIVVLVKPRDRLVRVIKQRTSNDLTCMSKTFAMDRRARRNKHNIPHLQAPSVREKYSGIHAALSFICNLMLWSGEVATKKGWSQFELHTRAQLKGSTYTFTYIQGPKKPFGFMVQCVCTFGCTKSIDRRERMGDSGYCYQQLDPDRFHAESSSGDNNTASPHGGMDLVISSVKSFEGVAGSHHHQDQGGPTGWAPTAQAPSGCIRSS
ncbi:hypothetical protein B0O80DRAFT_262364 [Mortierella sp. GBAus27b]|nr:hypothetical protein B0O80DRAFT_262364 [Mortierella sp. GBAus27b]